ncbi:MAG: DedA family protein [Parcubacteria group bacterium]|nr:DedA family protein [Parcubacteria group bacterium]
MHEDDTFAHEHKTPTRLRRLYNWVVHFSETPYALAALFTLAFVESSFFPIPPDVLLVPLVALNRRRWVVFAVVATIGSVLGGLLGYIIGFGFYEFVGKPIISRYGLEHAVEAVRQRYAANAFLAVFGAAFTPIPYKVFTIAAGLFRIPVGVFLIASILGRGGRFFIVAALLAIFGRRARDLVERYFGILSIVFLALLVAGFVVLKLL